MPIQEIFNAKGRVSSLSGIVADHLTQQIESGQLLPGERLVQMDLAQQFGVSRVAVRDALQKVKQRGLVVDSETRGVTVRPLSIKSIEEIFEVRELIEGYLVREAAKNITPADTRYLLSLLQQMNELAIEKDFDAYVDKDRELHSYICSKSNREFMVDIWNMIWLRFKQARGVAKRDTEWLRDWVDQASDNHEQLLQALTDGDGERAETIYRDIVRKSGRLLVDELRLRGWATEEDREAVGTDDR